MAESNAGIETVRRYAVKARKHWEYDMHIYKEQVKTLNVNKSCFAHLLPPRERSLFGQLLDIEGMRTGAELGVFLGDNAYDLLSKWGSCTRFYLIDNWTWHPNTLIKAGNVQAMAKLKLKKFSKKTVFLNMNGTSALEYIGDGELDFIYIDAHHDYCSVNQEIHDYWKKLRPGGIMSGQWKTTGWAKKSWTPSFDFAILVLKESD